VQNLRASTVERNDLAVAIRTLGDELAGNPSAPQPTTFSVAVEGETRELHPIARDEICKVAAEAMLLTRLWTASSVTESVAAISLSVTVRDQAQHAHRAMHGRPRSTMTC
jgi:hypothetical protein